MMTRSQTQMLMVLSFPNLGRVYSYVVGLVLTRFSQCGRVMIHVFKNFTLSSRRKPAYN